MAISESSARTPVLLGSPLSSLVLVLSQSCRAKLAKRPLAVQGAREGDHDPSRDSACMRDPLAQFTRWSFIAVDYARSDGATSATTDDASVSLTIAST